MFFLPQWRGQIGVERVLSFHFSLLMAMPVNLQTAHHGAFRFRSLITLKHLSIGITPGLEHPSIQEYLLSIMLFCRVGECLSMLWNPYRFSDWFAGVTASRGQETVPLPLSPEGGELKKQY
jgi:hypothetical protein